MSYVSIVDTGDLLDDFEKKINVKLGEICGLVAFWGINLGTGYEITFSIWPTAIFYEDLRSHLNPIVHLELWNICKDIQKEMNEVPLVETVDMGIFLMDDKLSRGIGMTLNNSLIDQFGLKRYPLE